MRALAAVLAALLAGPVHGAASPWPLPPGDAVAAQPSLVAGSDGTVFLSWIEHAADAPHRLRFARAGADGGFGPARTIAEGRGWFVNWADFPALLPLGDARLASFILKKSAALPYAYDLMLLHSSDGGLHWSTPTPVHDDGTKTEHGFAALWAESDGALGVAWLDGRATAAGAGPGHGHGGAMALRAARFDGARKQAEWAIDASTCDCCQVDAARSGDGVVLVYRDRTPEEVRDIAIVRRGAGPDAAWSAPRLVHADDWFMPACPVNGPAVAASDQRVAVAWYTAAGGRPRVQVAQSRDGGQQFEEPLVLATGEAVLGRVDLAFAGDLLLALWLEQHGSTQQLWLARIGPDGRQQRGQVAELTARGRASGFPRLAASGGQVFLAWTDVVDGKPRVRGARVALDAP